jgi:magnesium transporter
VALASHRQNEIARQISGWAAIIAVPTLIASLFGTNFIDIPALHWRFGFLSMVAVSVILSVVVWAALRRARWL